MGTLETLQIEVFWHCMITTFSTFKQVREASKNNEQETIHYNNSRFEKETIYILDIKMYSI